MSNQEKCECCGCNTPECECECCCGTSLEFNMADYMMIIWGAK
jgi:hypothetical protein